MENLYCRTKIILFIIEGGNVLKKNVLVVVLIFIVLLISCTNKETSSKNFDKDIIEIVKKVEVQDHKFSNFYLSPQEYIDSLNGLFADFFTKNMHFDRSYLPHPLELEIIDFSPEQIESVKKSREDMGNVLDITVQISKIYNDTDKEQKYVYTKSTMINNNDSTKNYMTRKYTFSKENGEWRIKVLQKAIFNDMENTELNQAPYTTLGNEQIEYIYIINPLQK